MTIKPFIDGSSGCLTPSPEITRWLSASKPLSMRAMALGLVSPGMFVFALDFWRENLWTRSQLTPFLMAGPRARLAAIALPSTPAVVKLLAKLHIDRIESPDELTEVRAWLYANAGVLPKVILHAPVVHWHYLRALIRQPALQYLPYPSAFGVDADSVASVDRLANLVGEFHDVTTQAGWTAPAQQQALSRMSLIVSLEYRIKHLRRSFLRVPVRLQPDSFVWLPRSYEEFEWLAQHQKNCVDLYFQRAVSGECQIVAVGKQRQMALTAELRSGADIGMKEKSFWYPVQVLSKGNRLADKDDISRLMRWLALSQVGATRNFSYRRNLVRLMAWASEKTIDGEPRTLAEAHWFLIIEVLTTLLADWTTFGSGAQLALPLAALNSSTKAFTA